MVGIIIDLVLVAVAVFCLLWGWHKGFVSSVLGFGRFFIATLLSFWLSGPLGNWAQPWILEKMGSGESDNLFVKVFQTAVSSGYVARVLAFAAVFILTSIAVKVLELVLNLVAKIPGLHFMNGLLGMLMGAVNAFFWVELLTVLFIVAAGFFSESISWLSATSFEKTILAKWFYEHNFFRMIFESMMG